MPLGIVSNEAFEAEAVHVDIRRGRGTANNTPQVIREIAAEASISGVPTKEVAAELGLSKSSVSAYANDATSTATYNEAKPELKRANDEVRNRILVGARARLLTALDHITPDKLRDAKVRDVAAVAKDMSAIMSNINPVGSTENPGAQFVFHVPAAKKESDFDIIDVTS